MLIGNEWPVIYQYHRLAFYSTHNFAHRCSVDFGKSREFESSVQRISEIMGVVLITYHCQYPGTMMAFQILFLGTGRHLQDI
jgi:hypothetical protein